MSVIYLETSALLHWILGQEHSEKVRSSIAAAKVTVTSTLTLTESNRALLRSEHDGSIRGGDVSRLRGLLQRVQGAWMRMGVTEDVLARAAGSFPREPVRTLDAIHLATALAFTEVFPDLSVLSFDERIVENSRELGIL
jgi:predicted nucleic acid-binding protein